MAFKLRWLQNHFLNIFGRLYILYIYTYLCHFESYFIYLYAPKEFKLKKKKNLNWAAIIYMVEL